MKNKKNISRNIKTPNACTLCAKTLSECHTLSRIEMKIDCYYIRANKSLEAMNGLGRHTKEYLCKDCFNIFAKHMKKIVQAKKNASP